MQNQSNSLITFDTQMKIALGTWKIQVAPMGFELRISAMPVQCSTSQLSYEATQSGAG